MTAPRTTDIDTDELEARLLGALAEADLTEAAAAAAQPRDDSDLFEAMAAEAASEDDDLDI